MPWEKTSETSLQTTLFFQKALALPRLKNSRLHPLNTTLFTAQSPCQSSNIFVEQISIIWHLHYMVAYEVSQINVSDCLPAFIGWLPEGGNDWLNYWLVACLLESFNDHLFGWLIEESIDWLVAWKHQWMIVRVIGGIFEWLIAFLVVSMTNWLLDCFCIMPSLNSLWTKSWRTAARRKHCVQCVVLSLINSRNISCPATLSYLWYSQLLENACVCKFHHFFILKHYCLSRHFLHFLKHILLFKKPMQIS